MSIRRGGRVVLKTAAGAVMVKEIKRRTANSIGCAASTRARRVHAPDPQGALDRAHRLGEPVRKAALGNQAAESNHQVYIPTLEGAP
jgi:hypothetical protein